MIKPLQDRVIVERLEAEERTAAGIIIPDTAQEKPQSGRVIAAGPGLRDKKNKFVPLDVKKGDEVLFAKFGGTDVTLDGKEYLILKESDILAVVSK